MRDILHISDVHFGPPHLPAVAEGVLRLIDRRRPDLVVLSGDFTQRAKRYQFRQAREFVDRIPVPSITVPGNHDVPMYRFWERIFRPYGAYRRHFDEEMEPTFADDELFVVGINSAFNWTIDNGRIPRRRLAEVEESMRTAAADRFRIVVVHHPIVPPPRVSKRAVIRRASQAAEAFARCGVELVLSGHCHQSYLGSTEEAYPRGVDPVIIVHSGTTTSNRGRDVEAGRNSCNWIRADDHVMTVEQLFWMPDPGRFEVHDTHEFTRRGTAGSSSDGR